MSREGRPSDLVGIGSAQVGYPNCLFSRQGEGPKRGPKRNLSCLQQEQGGG